MKTRITLNQQDIIDILENKYNTDGKTIKNISFDLGIDDYPGSTGTFYVFEGISFNIV